MKKTLTARQFEVVGAALDLLARELGNNNYHWESRQDGTPPDKPELLAILSTLGQVTDFNDGH